MRDVIGVRFRTNGKIYYFDPKEYNVPEGCYVIVETARGVEYGHVVTGRKSVDEKSIPQDLKPIIRLATEEDSRQFEANKEKSKKAYDICLEKIKEHELEMKLIAAEYTFDNSKVLFYFTADGRVDFRELVRDLASVFRTRIELRQVGVRDETKLAGGIGMCGRELAATHICRSLYRYPSRWLRSRTCPLTRPRYPVPADVLCAVSSMSRTHMSISIPSFRIREIRLPLQTA